MKEKVKEEFINEVVEMRKRIAELEKSEARLKQAEQTLRESEEKYRDLVESMIDVIYTLDTVGNVTSINKAVRTLLGVGPEQVIGKTFNKWISKEVLPQAMADFKQVLKGEELTFETMLLDKDGNPHNVEISATPIIKDRKVVGTRGIIRDVTQRKRAEEALREREAFNFALFQYNPMETIVVDLEGKVVKSNLAKRASGGRLPNIGDVMYKDCAGKYEVDMYAELMECIRSGKVKEFPEQKYGERFLSITISPFPQGAIIISRDVTQRKRAEEALKRQDKERMDFINALIHEIKTPLTVMVASTELLREELLADSSPLYDLAKNLDTATHNLNRRVSELIEFAKLQSSELILHRQGIDIYGLAQDVATQVNTLFQNKGQTLSLELSTSLPKVEADPDRVVQILLNLLTNASKFSPPNSEISLQAYPADTHLILEVCDCAPPIGPREAKLIFKPYYLGKERGGLGLGLSICRRLVELQGGKIWVETQGKGNSFKFSLPLVSKLGDRT